MTVALVLVSHSAKLADGLVDIARQMAADVPITPVGGTDDGRIGTSFDRVEAAITAQLEAGADAVVLLTDLGSATLTAESVLDLLDDPRVVLVDVPFVEGTVAAAVAAQGGATVDAVVAAARTAYAPAPAAPARTVAPGAGPNARRTVTVRNRLGLHARPAAVIARLAEDFDAAATIDGVDAASVLEIMGLGRTAGDTVEVAADGPRADEVVAAIAAAIEDGFGET